MSRKMLCIGISEDLSSITHITTLAGEGSKAISDESCEILENLHNILITNHTRKSIEGSLGKWLTLKKPSGVFFSLVSGGYPDRLGYKALDSAHEAYEAFLKSHDLEGLKSDVLALLSRYNSPEDIDKLTAVNTEIEGIASEVKGNIDRLVGNAEALDSLEDRSLRIREQAGEYERNTRTLRKQLWWRNVKGAVLVVVALVVAIALLVALLKFI